MEKNCDTCIHKADESKDAEGKRMVDCDANVFQMYAPFADECKHWEKDDRHPE